MAEPANHQDFESLKRSLQAFQSARLNNTYADLKKDPEYVKIGHFFFEMLYACQVSAGRCLFWNSCMEFSSRVRFCRVLLIAALRLLGVLGRGFAAAGHKCVVCFGCVSGT